MTAPVSPQELRTWLLEQAESSELRRWADDLLFRLCESDTSLGDVRRMAQGEKQCFDLFLKEAGRYLQGEPRYLGVPESLPIDPHYTNPFYAGVRKSVADVYAGRSNLYITSTEGRTSPSASEHRWLLNAHVDTVPPYIPPSRQLEGAIHGRGSSDNKGGMVVAALVGRLLQSLRAQGIEDQPAVDYLFSIDQEMGGNGSLAAASQLDLGRTSIVVLEPTKLRPHPANRGELWFQGHVEAYSERARRCLLPAMTIAALGIGQASRQLRAESIHPLFEPDDAQGCFGILGNYGHHPATACGAVEVRVEIPSSAASTTRGVIALVVHILASATTEGRIRISEATRGPDAGPVGRARDDGMRTWSIRLQSVEAHMGSRERDSDAILKLAEVASGLAKVGASGLRLPLEPKGMDLEGGQGFLPTHSLEDVKARLAAAFEHGVSRWREIFGISDVEATAWIHFDKLHNEAYNSNEQAIGTRALADASALLTDVRPSITGWQVSCDARIFARQSGDVTTFGAGSLDLAHGPREVVTMDDIMTAAAMLTMAILAKQEGLGG